MSILTRPISFKREKPAAEAPQTAPGDATPSTPTPSPVARKGKASAVPQFALSPRANLLPPEISDNQRKRSTRRGLRLMVIAVVAIVLIAGGGSWYAAFQADVRLELAQNETGALTSQRVEYLDVANTIKSISQTEAAQRVGASTEIDWAAYLAELQSTLPGDVSLSGVLIDSAGISTPYPQSEVPLEQPRIATLTFTADSPVLPSIPDWIDRLSALPGFADASPGSVNLDEGVYSASVTMHIDQGAYARRFEPDAETEGAEG
jgi:type II secretory pathway pseudopilin PulG